MIQRPWRLSAVQDVGVVALHADHVLLEELEGEDVGEAGDDLDARLPRLQVGADERAGMVRLEGVLDPQRYLRLAQALRRARVDRLHAHVGELVGDVVVGLADDAHGVLADDLRIRRGEVELLVDDGFARTGDDGDARQRHFRIAAVVCGHQGRPALRVAGDDRQFLRNVDVGEGAADVLVEVVLALVAPAGQVDIARIDAALAQEQGGVVGRMRLAEGGQHLAHGQEMVLELEMAVGAQPVEIDQAGAHALDALADEGVGVAARHRVVEDLGILGEHRLGNRGQRVAPAPAALGELAKRA